MGYEARVTPPQEPTLRAHKITRSRLSGWTTALIAGLALTIANQAPALAGQSDVETAALAPGGLRANSEVPLPQLLKDEDAARYSRIFALQDESHWADADKLVAKLTNKLLLGHVLAQRYLAHDYHSKYAELSAWLERYADHPEAAQIYHLALARMPKGAHPPRRPEGQSYNTAIGENAAARDGGGRLSAADERRAGELRRSIRHHIDEGSLSAAERLLAGPETQRLLAPGEYDQLRAEVASGLYFRNEDSEALAFADAAPARGKHVNAALEWAAGLASWRLKHYDQAVRHFERLATGESVDSWSRAAGAYWAARAHLRNQQPERVSHWLELAANYPYTFYGIIARRLAGKPFDFNWELPAFTRADLTHLMGTASGMRALALVQVGEDARAEQELRRIKPSQPEMAHALLAVSQRTDMPSLGMELADQVTDAHGRRYDAALYPVPSWEPKGGYSIDRALVLALIRQESKFAVHALSPVGAQGLMQLMPSTARFASVGSLIDRDKRKLFDPEVNITLGQNYLAHLMSIDSVGNNLFMLAAAYNGGPGNVSRWQRQIKHDNDPLLFLESIPNRETRLFVEHVLANYWIYRDQLGQATPALDAIAEGQWPTYKPDEERIIPVASTNGGH
jgi:soluble lytic murein transglycosylase-like protein